MRRRLLDETRAPKTTQEAVPDREAFKTGQPSSGTRDVGFVQRSAAKDGATRDSRGRVRDDEGRGVPPEPVLGSPRPVSSPSPRLRQNLADGVDPKSAPSPVDPNDDATISPDPLRVDPNGVTAPGHRPDFDSGPRVTLSPREALLQLCRVDFHAFCEFVLRDEETNARVEQAPIHVRMAAEYDANQRLVVMAHPESGKAMPLDTEVATPDGWRRIGSLRVGDVVLDRDGAPTRVTFVSPVTADRDVFELELDDGARVAACDAHRWVVRDATRWRRERRSHDEIVVTTRDVAESELRLPDSRFRFSIPVAGTLRFDATNPEPLPVPPYVLGAWLGDGDSTGATLTFHRDDAFVWERCRDLVGSCAPRPDPRRPTVMRAVLGNVADRSARTNPDSLRRRLRRLGVIGAKHIPPAYLVAPESDRLELLAGILDTDGYAGTKSRVELTSTSLRLASDVVELVRGLGIKATLTTGRATIDGRDVGPKYRVAFTATRQVFRLPRKVAACVPAARTLRLTYRHVVAVRRVPKCPVVCIAVDAPSRTFVATRAAVVTHNTSQFAVARTLFELGRDTRLRFAVVGNTQNGAGKTVAAIKEYVEKSDDYRAVFPDVRPGDAWSNVSLKVRRDVISKDFSVQAVGYHGDVIGSRVDRVVADDLLDHENTRTEDQRRETKVWWRRALMSRVTESGRVTFLANAWHLDDLAHDLERIGWRTVRFPVLDRLGKPTWPERWPAPRVDDVRVNVYGPLDFARIMMCRTRDDGGVVFRDSWLDRCKRRGVGYGTVRYLDPTPSGCLVVVGVDLAAAKVGRSGARTCFFGLMMWPDGTRQVLFCDSGRYGAPEIIAILANISERFPDARFVVESNAAQSHLVDMANEANATMVPVVPFYTGANKYDPRYGLDAMSAEFEAGRWLVPTGRDGRDVDPEVEAWLSELEVYDPTRHTGDRVMASWFARTWGMRAVRRLRNSATSGLSARVLG